MADKNIKEWDAWYIQKDKINELYNTYYKKRNWLSKLIDSIDWRPANVKIRLLFAEVDIKRIINKEDKGAYSKLEELIGILDLIDLNETNLKNTEKIIGKYIYFKERGEFRENEKDKEAIEIRGNVNEYNFLCNCSVKHFSEISSSFLRTLLDVRDIIGGHELNIFFLGKLRSITEPKHIILLDGIYVYGDTGYINDLIKKAKTKNNDI